MAALKYYIGEKSNPQFSKPYYVAYGTLTTHQAKMKENDPFHSQPVKVTAYDTQEDYTKRVEQLKSSGHTVYTRP